MRATCTACLLILDLIARVTFNEVYKSRSSRPCAFSPLPLFPDTCLQLGHTRRPQSAAADCLSCSGVLLPDGNLVDLYMNGAFAVIRCNCSHNFPRGVPASRVQVTHPVTPRVLRTAELQLAPSLSLRSALLDTVTTCVGHGCQVAYMFRSP
jgi:hypothetical protein